MKGRIAKNRKRAVRAQVTIDAYVNKNLDEYGGGPHRLLGALHTPPPGAI